MAAGALWGLIATGGGTAFLAQVGRDRGRSKQPDLWRSWGGPPATRALRYRNTENRVLLDRRRIKLEKLLGSSLPSQDDETKDPEGSDQIYESAVGYLLEATRDTTRFPLVFSENANYGFRRNLLGFKPYGLIISAAALLGACSLFVQELGFPPNGTWKESIIDNPENLVIVRLVGATFISIVFVTWFLVVKTDWVKTTADAFAQRLVGAIDNL